MIDPKCPECGALLKKKDFKNDKCWKCKTENITAYFSIQEDIKKPKESSRPLSEKEKHYWSFPYRLNSWLTVEIVITLGIILSLIFSIYGLFVIFGSYDRMSEIYQKIIWAETIGIIIFIWKTVTVIQLKVSLASSTVKES